MALETRLASDRPDVMAPDGSEVRILCALPRASTALFTLTPGAVSKAVVHRTVDEVWYFISGQGRMWRRLGSEEKTEAVGPGTSLTIPVGAHFQFRCDSAEPLVAVAATLPPWPGPDEAVFVPGIWESLVAG